MDFWSFEVTIYSELDDIVYKEHGILYAEDVEEAARKIELFYEGDRIEGIELWWETDEGIFLTEPPMIMSPLDTCDNVEGGRTYTVNMEDIS